MNVFRCSLSGKSEVTQLQGASSIYVVITRERAAILYHQFSPPHLTHYKLSLFPLQQLNITIRQHTQKFTVKVIFCELSKVNKIVELERCEYSSVALVTVTTDNAYIAKGEQRS